MNQSTFNLKMISSFMIALAIYFMSENLSETRAEFDSLINRSTKENIDSSFGSKKGKSFKTVLERLFKCKKSRKQSRISPENSELPETITDTSNTQVPIENIVDNKFLGKFRNMANKVKNSNKIKAVTSKAEIVANKVENNIVKKQTFKQVTPKIVKRFNDYNDIAFYIIFIGLLLAIMFYGRQWWEDNQEYKEWADSNTGFISGNLLLIAALFLFQTNIFEKNMDTFYINPKTCNYKIFMGNSKYKWVSLFINLLTFGILVGIGIKYNINQEEENKEESRDNHLITIGLLIFAFLLVCGFFYFGYEIENNSRFITFTNDKLYIAVMLLITISVFLSWSKM